jgi:hypothetical protein
LENSPLHDSSVAFEIERVFSRKQVGKTHFDSAFLLGKGQKKQGLKPEFDFSLADAVAARYDTVTIRVSLCYACFGIVSDDPDKTRLIGDSQSGGLYFFQCFQPFSNRKR